MSQRLDYDHEEVEVCPYEEPVATSNLLPSCSAVSGQTADFSPCLPAISTGGPACQPEDIASAISPCWSLDSYDTPITVTREDLQWSPTSRPESVDEWLSNSPSVFQVVENASCVIWKRLFLKDELLLHLRDVERLKWKEVADRFKLYMGHAVKVPALQMRKKRLDDRLRGTCLVRGPVNGRTDQLLLETWPSFSCGERTGRRRR